MRHLWLATAAVASACAILRGVAGIASAQMVLESEVIGAGATRMQGGGWVLDATVGQAQAGLRQNANGFHLDSGFWQPHHASASDRIFSNGFEATPAARVPHRH